MNDIIVNVYGKAGAGKTTIAKMIEHFLSLEFDVTLEDDESVGTTNDRLRKRIDALRDKVKITIKSTQLKNGDQMSKKQVLDYSNTEKLLLDRTVIVGLKGGTNLTGDIRYIDASTIVLVTEPTSTLDIETKVVHTVVNAANVDFIQFKTDRKKD